MKRGKYMKKIIFIFLFGLLMVVGLLMVIEVVELVDVIDVIIFGV